METYDARLRIKKYHKVGPFSKSGTPFLIAVTDDGRTVKGEMSKPRIGELYRFWGEWREQKNYVEKAFEFTHHEVIIDRSSKGVATYLRNYVETLGYAKAEYIVDRFGDDTLDVLRTNPEAVLEIKGFSRVQVDAIRRHFEENFTVDPVAYSKLIDMFGGNGFPRKLVKALLKNFGSGAPEKVKENPYILLAYPGVGWGRLDPWATSIGGYDKQGIERHRAAILEALETIALAGHTYAMRADIDAAAYKLIGCRPSGDAWSSVVSRGDVVCVTAERAQVIADDVEGWSIDEARDYLEKVNAGNLAANDAEFSLPRLDSAEREIAGRLVHLARHADPLPYELDTTGLNEDQVRAVETIRDNGVCILAGPPGTGKSYTLAKVLGSLTQSGMRRIRVVAPTGKAAKRAAELLDSTVPEGCHISCTTIHRALEPIPSDAPEGVPKDDAKFGRGRDAYGFRRNAENPLEDFVVVVDESSMVDVILMASLLRAVPVGARIVFVGDHNQLPSVGPGSVLRDMMAASVPTAILSKIVRSDGGGRVVRACHSIKDGVVPEPAETVVLPCENWIHVEIEDPADIAGYVVARHESARRNGNFDPYWDMQVVAAQNSNSPISCYALNTLLSDLLNTTAEPPAINGDESFGPPFRKGDKVVRTKNGLCDELIEVTSGPDGFSGRIDWVWAGKNWTIRETDVVNGDMGYAEDVVATDSDCFAVIRFRTPERLCRLPYGESHCMQAYAMTAHRMQGSGYPYVIVPVHTDIYRELATREWFYTAISRAERVLVTVGPFDAIKRMVGYKTVDRRRTRLAERIGQAMAERMVACGK